MTRRRRKPRSLPDPRSFLRRFVPWVALLALLAWWSRPASLAERIDEMDRQVTAMEAEHGK